MHPFRDEAPNSIGHTWTEAQIYWDITHTAYNGTHPTSTIRADELYSDELPEPDGQARLASQILRWERKWFTVIETSEVTHYNRKIIYQKEK